MRSFLEILKQRTEERIEDVEDKLDGSCWHITYQVYQIVDLRDEIALFEMEVRSFPPRSGSVSKPKKSLEPEDSFVYVRFARSGRGKNSWI